MVEDSERYHDAHRPPFRNNELARLFRELSEVGQAGVAPRCGVLDVGG